MKLWFLSVITFLSLIYVPAAAQTDSLAFVQARWQKKKIKKGVVLKQYQFRGNLFSSNQSISIQEVKRSRKLLFSIGYESKTLKPTSEFGKASGAVAALNGTFFDTKDGGSVDYIKANGKVINDNRLRENNRTFNQKAAITIRKGKVGIEKWDGSATWEQALPADEIMVSGPLLVYRDNREKLDSAAFNVTRHPRTLIARTTSSTLMITVDGRNENAAGMNLFELQSMLRWLRAYDGLNLDGGGSTTLWIYNQPDNGVVNFPSDNKLWDHAGERKVANVILLKKR